MSEENITAEIKHLEKVMRKIRKDRGEKRIKYQSGLDKRYLSYLKRANAKGFEMELTEAHFLELDNAMCYYCEGTPSGFDRVDSKKGYLINNVVPCCFRCNIMKHTMSQQDFYHHIEQIHKTMVLKKEQ